MQKTISSKLDMLKRWWRFNRLYFGRPPWDTGISPPELTAVIEGPHALPAGSALDLGCGTGTNALYMAAHGWQVTGVDFALRAIRKARFKARRQGLPARFIASSVTRLPMLDNQTFDLFLDIGCFHGIPEASRVNYARELGRLSKPGSLFLLYAFAPFTSGKLSIGATKAEIKELFAPYFEIKQAIDGVDTSSGRVSSWYTLRRNV